jgi:hypothetical protein
MRQQNRVTYRSAFLLPRILLERRNYLTSTRLRLRLFLLGAMNHYFKTSGLLSGLALDSKKFQDVAALYFASFSRLRKTICNSEHMPSVWFPARRPNDES